jgi:predicted transcriptional regulator
MTYSVSVSPDVYALLRQRARQSKVSPDMVADDALRRYLHQEEPTWRQSFDALLARVQANSAPFSSDEIEADITAAAEEVKELRRARHSAG